jgi:hypothetical protein
MKYAIINPIDSTVYDIQDVMAASDIHLKAGAPYLVQATDEAVVGDVYDPEAGTFTTLGRAGKAAESKAKPEAKAEPSARPSHTYSKRDD